MSGKSIEDTTADPSGSSSAVQGFAELFSEDTRALVRRYYPATVLAFLFSFMIAVRVQTADRFRTESGIIFSGNDPWYHYRTTMYTVKNWPHTMQFDPWTGYPTGNSADHFGTLFDQILATVALVIGLGSPSETLVKEVLLYSPPVFAALTLIPTYYLGKRLAQSRAAGLLAATLLTFMPGVFFSRGLVAVADHNIAEPLFMSLGVLGILAAIGKANEDVIIWEVVSTGNFDDLRGWVLKSVLAGVAIASYILVWPPGVMLVGILGMAFLLYSLIARLRETTPIEPALLTGGLSLTTTAVILLPFLDVMRFQSTSVSLAQVSLSLAVGGGCLFLAWLDRNADKLPAASDYPNASYAGTVGVIGLVSVLVFKTAAPSAWRMIRDNLIRTVGLGTHAQVRTIGEAQPFATSLDQVPVVVFREYGAPAFLALFGALLLSWKIGTKLRNDELVADNVFMLTWGIFLTFAAFTQVRFNYYLVVPVCITAAYAVYAFVTSERLGQSIAENAPRNLKGYQWMSLAVIFLLLTTGLVVPLSTSVANRGQYHGPGGYAGWQEPLNWMNENTPEPEGMEYYGEYDRQSDFNYPDGSYGVMSWWDYGHWMTITAERIPVANPFQQHAPKAAEYLLATNETQAQNVAESLSKDNESDVRYVMVDWKMVSTSSKFTAPVVWNDKTNRSDMMKHVYQSKGNGLSYALSIKKQRYYESLMTRLYYYHGSNVQPSPVVVDYEMDEVQTGNGPVSVPVTPDSVESANGKAIKRFKSMQAAQNYVKNDSTSTIGGVGIHPREEVEALQHYRLVKVSKGLATQSNRYKKSLIRTAKHSEYKMTMQDFNPAPTWVKVFERVDGATVKGTNAPPNSTVVATVKMKAATHNLEFTYRQKAKADANGNWTMTLPYSTTGYENFGPENGHTNVSVRGASQYTFQVVTHQTVTNENGNNSVSVDHRVAKSHVPESKVIGEDDSPIKVTLQKVTDEKSDDESSSSDNDGS